MDAIAQPLQTLREGFVNTLPLYIQIAEGLIQQIESGDLAPGERLPPERELSRMFGVNRMTLRRALMRLELQGLLNRRQGAGTYVSEPKIERQADELVSFSRGMTRRGYLPGAKLLRFERKPAAVRIARELSILVGAEVFYFHRLRYLDHEPVMLEEFWMPVDRFPDLESFDLINRFIFDIVEDEYGLTVTRARQSLEPVVATDYEAEMLNIQVGSPLMLERRLSFDEHDEPIEYGKDLYRGDRFRFVTEIAPMEQNYPGN
jgi:GntR family transcriptional regulator